MLCLRQRQERSDRNSNDRQLAEIDGNTEKRNHYLRILMKCRKGTPLTAVVSHALIDRIEVYKDKRVVIRFLYSGKEISGLKGGDKS